MLACLPGRGAVNNPIPDRAAVAALCSFQWTGDADEFHVEPMRTGRDNSVAVAIVVDEVQVRRELWIPQRFGAGPVPRLGVFEAASYSVREKHIDRRLGFRSPRPVRQIKSSQRMFLGEPMLLGFHETRRG